MLWCVISFQSIETPNLSVTCLCLIDMGLGNRFVDCYEVSHSGTYINVRGVCRNATDCFSLVNYFVFHTELCDLSRPYGQQPALRGVFCVVSSAHTLERWSVKWFIKHIGHMCSLNHSLIYSFLHIEECSFSCTSSSPMGHIFNLSSQCYKVGVLLKPKFFIVLFYRFVLKRSDYHSATHTKKMCS